MTASLGVWILIWEWFGLTMVINAAFLRGDSRYYAEEMYKLWKEDPNSVHPSWNVYFSGMSRGIRSEDAFRPPPNLVDTGAMESAPQTSTSRDMSGNEDHQKASETWSCWARSGAARCRHHRPLLLSLAERPSSTCSARLSILQNPANTLVPSHRSNCSFVPTKSGVTTKQSLIR